MIAEYKNENGIPFLEIKTPLCSATICLLGAQVLSWKPTDHEECLYTSPDAVFQEGTPIRGGIPLCWPWFGKRDGHPSHGIARTALWEIDHTGIDEQSLEASVHLHLFPEDENLPAAFLRISLSDQLRMRLQTTSRQRGGCLTGAFHNYFQVGDIEQCRVIGLSNTPYEELGEQYKAVSVKKADLPLSLSSPTDRIYSGKKAVSSVVLEDPLLNRSFSIDTEHSHSMVVWNPWKEGAKTMKDLPDDDWKRFICIEPALTKHTPMNLSPGQSHIMRQTIKVNKLA